MAAGTFRSQSQWSDAELVAHAQEELPDRSESLELLFARHLPAMVCRARRMVQSQADAEDVAQEVCKNVLRALPDYRPDRPFAHWLQVIVRNACLGRLRRRRREARGLWELRSARPRTTGSPAPDPILRGVLLELLDSLHPGTRDALLMRIVEERPYGEIAARLGIGESAVKMRVARGRRAIADRYLERSPSA